MKVVFGDLKIFSALLIIIFVLNCFEDLGSEAQILPKKEVEALRQIQMKLRKSGWDFGVDPCSGTGGWIVEVEDESWTNSVKCNCTYNSSTVCHVISIELKRQNLTGELPEEIADLPFLQVLDLSRNYINGSIPPRWASLPLTRLSITGNRVSGTIPKELGSITTLQELYLQDNQLEGALPEELGNLRSLEIFYVSGNNLMGELPAAFGKLTNMTRFNINGNGITGKIPDFIQNWKSLDLLDMQGTSMEGPINSTLFSTLVDLTELRISDLSGPSMGFPQLHDLKILGKLALRNCSISGVIPEYIWDNLSPTSVDLSFNNLTGGIPSKFKRQSRIKYLYLTNNMLTGDIPNWILNSNTNDLYLDISNNNFTGPPPLYECRDQSNLNLAGSYSPTVSSSIPWCYKRNLPCSNEQYGSLFINCGGDKLISGGHEYLADSSPSGPSTFHFTDSWASSSTGDFRHNENAIYMATNTTALNTTNPGLYSTARISPLSLKYYGLCLKDGSYNVQLHFAELVFTANQTYERVGRRIFDVSIQGVKILKDFNIVDRAGGPGIGYTETFPALVTSNTLEIHLYWAGKGTTEVPNRGVYGPLISAITVTPNFDKGSRVSVGTIIGIVAGSCAALILILILLCVKGCFGGKELKDKELEGVELQTGYFSLRQTKTATNNLDTAN